MSISSELGLLDERKSKSLAYLTDRFDARAKEKNQNPTTNNLTVIFPPWPKIIGAMPNLFLRSALFGIGSSNKLLQREKITAPNGYEICVTGNKLTTSDLKYLDVLFSLASNENICEFTIYRFLKLMSKTDSMENRKNLKKFFSRVIATSIEVLDKKGTNQSYEGSIIIDKKLNEITGTTIVTLNPHLRRFFQRTGFTLLNQNISLELKRHPLAQWLFGYYSSHARPYPILIKTMHELCGSESENIDSFTQCVKIALKKISIAYTKHGKTFNWEIKDDLVSVLRTATNSQNRNVIKNMYRKAK